MAQTVILRLPAVRERIGWSRSSIYAAMQRGEFPKSVPIGRRAVGWVASELEDFISARIAQRDAKAARE